MSFAPWDGAKDTSSWGSNMMPLALMGATRDTYGVCGVAACVSRGSSGGGACLAFGGVWNALRCVEGGSSRRVIHAPFGALS